MDVEQLHQVLQQSFAAEASVRHPAEETIKNLKLIPGSILLLLQVVQEKQVRYEVRQAAAIQLKNICREGWADRVGFLASSTETMHTPALLSLNDKQTARPQLIAVLLGEPEKSIRDLLAETLHNITIHDFPEQWGELIPTLLQAIQTGVQDMTNKGLQVHNALVALRKVCKRYEYKSKEQRGPLNEIVHQSFPLLLPLAQQLSADNQHSLEAAMMLKQILKIFWSSTQFYLPGGETYTGLARPEHLQPWFDLLIKVLSKPLPEAHENLEPRNQPVDVQARNQWPWWKVKKWAVQIMSRLFSRYGIPGYAEDGLAKEFANYFSHNVAPQFLGPVLETLNLRPSGKFCTDRVVYSCLTFVDMAVELAATYKMLKPYLDFILFQVCFPTMCLSEEDIECFNNDPVEFVQKQNSPLADFYDPRMSAISLITDLVKHRGKDVTQNLLGRMTELLHRYGSAPVEQKNHIEKDGALLVFGSLSRQLLANDKYAGDIEGLLVTSVFPDFNSPVGFLRFRACWMVQEFSGVKWTDDGTRLRTLLEMVLNRLSDPALPVQIEASKALRFLIEAEGTEETLLPVLPQILSEYFRIMNEIGNDEVVSALQVLLDKFGDHLEPHAIALVTQLTTTFDQYLTAGEDDDDDEAALAAEQCLQCIATVLKGVCGKESVLKALQPMLLPLVLRILGNDGEFIEYLESALDVLTFLTYFPTSFSPELWQAFPLIYIAFDQWAYDYLNMMVPCMQSYIQKSTDILLTGSAQLPEGNVPYIDLIMTMAIKTITNDRSNDAECRYALSLFMSLFHNCPGKIDNYMPIINEVVLGKLGQEINAEIPFIRFSIYQVLGSALYYNPGLELAELEKRGVVNQVFSKWITDSEKMDRWLQRKTSVIGFASIFSLPTSLLPQSLISLLPQIMHIAVRLALDLKDELENGGETQSKDDFDADAADDGDEGDLEGGFAEDEDVKNEIDEAYRKALQGVDSTFDDGMAGFLLGDWDMDEDIDEDYTSPIDQVDESILLSETLQSASQREPDAYRALQGALPQGSHEMIQRLYQASEEAKASVQLGPQQ